MTKTLAYKRVLMILIRFLEESITKDALWLVETSGFDPQTKEEKEQMVEAAKDTIEFLKAYPDLCYGCFETAFRPDQS